MTTPYAYSPPAPADRVRWAWQRRSESDYIFDFWTAVGWTLLSCGLFFYYVVYQLVRRMRDHNLRRLELLDAANTMAWERAVVAGRDAELRPRFERVAASLQVLRQMTTEFRDPVIWLVLTLVGGGIAQIVLNVLLDRDLVKHGGAEAAVEWELAAIYGELGTSLDHLPPAAPKTPHQYWLRVLALFGSCGLYGLWWLYDLMVEPNRHFQRDWGWEDGFVAGVFG